MEDNNRQIKHAALLAIGRSGSAEATPVLVDALIHAQDREHTLVSLRALTYLANPDTVDITRDVYRKSDDEDMRRHALVAMASPRSRG